jgi:hypothetical protein
MIENLSAENRDFWLSLERERFNVAHREIVSERIVEKPVTRVQTVLKPCNRKHLTSKTQQERDQMMFNAGRFAAGAVDRVAVEAHEALMENLGEE